MKRTLFPLISIFTVLLSACGMTIVPGSGKVVSEAREVSDYDQVVFSAPGEMTISQDGQEALEIETDDNLLQYIVTRVENRTLYIEVEPEVLSLRPTHDIHYTLSVKALKDVQLNGSGSIRMASLENDDFHFALNGSGDFSLDELTTQNADLCVAGSGSLHLQTLKANTTVFNLIGSGDVYVSTLESDTLTTTITGSGSASLDGKVTRQTVQLSGSGSYRAATLESTTADVTVSGSGNGQVWVTEQLEANVVGSGDVTYRGGAAVTQHVTGSGNIRSME